METLLWAIDLILVAAFCFWAIREDGRPKQDNMSSKNKLSAKDGGERTRNGDHA